MSAFSRGVQNVYRNPTRSIVTILILSLSFGLAAAMLQAITTLKAQTKELTSQLETVIQVRNAGATGMGTGVDMIPEEEIDAIQNTKIAQNIRGVDKQILVRNVFPEFFPNTSITVGNNAGRPLRVATHGEPAVVRFLEGRNFTRDDEGKSVAVVGTIYAKNRNLKVGSRFLETGKEAQAGLGKDIQAKPEDLEVIGIFTSAFAFGDNQAFLPLKTAQRIYGLENNISVAWFDVDEVANVSKVEKFMRDFWQNKRDVLTSQGKTVFVASSFGRIINIGQIAFILSLIVGGLITVFVFIITTIERTKEIGILKALGAANSVVIKQFLAEVFAMVFVAGVLGIIVFATLGPAFTTMFLGIQKFDVPQAVTEAGIAPVTSLVDLTFRLDVGVLVFLLLLTLFSATLGSIFPIWRAIKMKPAEALRYE